MIETARVLFSTEGALIEVTIPLIVVGLIVFSGQAMRLWKEFNDLFSILPFSAVIKGKILCMHGGLSPHLESLDDIRNVMHFLKNGEFLKKLRLIAPGILKKFLRD
ncbi:unnamed protein product [Gongylonema pulchrum]|uniref:Metallophos domain-containing protein n=1 Tax=Gongylonema pulchrum TaxID=637853 RepID=A0A183EU34_9BILA|nr:unnamed protein product [Gongylonema pulchrum]